MSDHWIRCVPADPTFQPTPESADEARDLLASFAPEADEVTAEFEEETRFFHPGSSWEGVLCSACGADAEPWWPEAMDLAEETRFEDLGGIAACCGASITLDRLRYVSPVAFGRFSLSAMNPNLETLTASQTRQLSDVLGCELVLVHLHF